MGRRAEDQAAPPEHRAARPGISTRPVTEEHLRAASNYRGHGQATTLLSASFGGIFMFQLYIKVSIKTRKKIHEQVLTLSMLGDH